MKRMMLGAMVLLSGCATGGSDGPACPPLERYSAAQERQAGDELAALPAGAMLRRMIDDYGAMRAWVRGACPAAR